MENCVFQQGNLATENGVACIQVQKTVPKNVVGYRIAIKDETPQNILNTLCFLVRLQTNRVLNSPDVPIWRGPPMDTVASISVRPCPIGLHDFRKEPLPDTRNADVNIARRLYGPRSDLACNYIANSTSHHKRPAPDLHEVRQKTIPWRH